MKIFLRHLQRLACFGLPACALFLASPLRADDRDPDREQKPGFFHRLGNSLFHGTRKLERSDAAPGYPNGGEPQDGTSAVNSGGRKSKHQPNPLPAPANASNPSSTPDSVSADTPKPKSKHSVAPKDDDPAPKPKHSAEPKVEDPAPKSAAANDKVPAKDQTASAPQPPSQAKDQTAQAKGKDAEHPIATPGHTTGFVKSPFPPYNELDARGMISGTLARDPTSGKIFRVP